MRPSVPSVFLSGQDKRHRQRNGVTVLLTVRRFACAMQAEDGHHQIPPADAFGQVGFKPRTPHIFTPEEIAAILTAAVQLTPEGSIRPAAYATLFALLVATGLRSSEA